MKAIDHAAEDAALFEEVIGHIEEVDPAGQTFRYPESIKYDQHLKDWPSINLAVVEFGRDEDFWRTMERTFEPSGDVLGFVFQGFDGSPPLSPARPAPRSRLARRTARPSDRSRVRRP